ncbi:MAG: hypothetical protein US69_C0017G0018 [candidate division TM6 bacterium GW2011_GWF2_38_10]|nr:MAG: hypothetical protein US69_C0017G0018 [candidate division TM6 bacterium GW2011_GWF2_38_10]
MISLLNNHKLRRCVVFLLWYVIFFSMGPYCMSQKINLYDCTSSNYSPDISFGIVDLKFDGESIKICELGDGPLSMFRGFDYLYGRGVLWERFWTYLATFSLPFGYVMSKRVRNEFLPEYMGRDMFTQLGGTVIQDFRSLLSYKPLNRVMHTSGKQKKYDIASDYSLLIIAKYNGENTKKIEQLQTQQNGILVLNEVLSLYANSKAFMHKLFLSDPLLHQYRPRAVLCLKHYEPCLAQKIIEKLQADLYVIKPINAVKGFGVLMVKKDELDTALATLFGKASHIYGRVFDASALAYWRDKKGGFFLVEAYAPSKIIRVDDVNYDATMRVAYVLSHNKGESAIHFLGSYWKLPEKGVNQKGSLLEQHRSSISVECPSAAFVDEKDFTYVKRLLTDALLRAYSHMLHNRIDLHKKPFAGAGYYKLLEPDI